MPIMELHALSIVLWNLFSRIEENWRLASAGKLKLVNQGFAAPCILEETEG